mgnify:CR=1 FL=1
MAVRAPTITVDTHDPTGAAQVSVSVWLTEEEQEGLLNRVFSQQPLLHDRARVPDALKLVEGRVAEQGDPDGATEGQITEKASWEVSLVE